MWLDGRDASMYESAIAQGQIVVAIVDGDVGGFVEAIPGEAVKLFVRGAMSGKGVGRRLMDTGLDMARRGHTGPIRIESTGNAVAFYAGYGFRKVGDGLFTRGASGVSIEVVHLSNEAS